MATSGFAGLAWQLIWEHHKTHRRRIEQLEMRVLNLEKRVPPKKV
jgi:hypothetical protein